MSLRDLVYKISTDIDDSGIVQMDKKVEKATSGLRDMGSGMQSVGDSMTKGITMPLVGVGAASIGVLKGFDDSMSEVSAISGATGKDFDDLREKAKQLGNDTAFSASDAADGMGVLAASGMETNDILETSGDLLTLMSAGSVDADTAARALTGTMAQFNMEANESGRISDVFAEGAASANTNVGLLQETMKMAGGDLANMNMEIEQATAMSGILANANIVGSQAGTTLSAMAREMRDNSQEFKDFGIDVYDTNGAMRDMGSILTDVEAKTGHMTDQQRDAAMATMMSGQAMKGVNAFISQGSEKYQELEDSMYGAEGAASKMAEIMESNIGGAFRSMGSKIGTFLIEVGDVLAPTIMEAANFIGDLTEKFTSLSPEAQGTIVKIAGVALAIGPLLSVGGRLTQFISDIPGKISTAKSAFSLLQGAMSPTTLIIAGVVAIGIVLYKNWDKIKEVGARLADTISEKWNSLKSATADAWDSMKTKITGVLDSIKGAWQKTKDFFSKPIKGAINVVENVKQKWEDRKKSNPKGSGRTGINRTTEGIWKLHDDEIVLPRKTANAYRALGGDKDNIPQTNNQSNKTVAPNITINVNGSDNPVATAKAVRKEIDSYMQDLLLGGV